MCGNTGTPASRKIALRRDQRGASAVEFALVFPLLMLIIFGIIQFGFVMAQSAALSNGARAGARYGVVNVLSTPTCADLVSKVRDGATTIGMTGANVVVTVKRGTSEASAAVVCSGAGSSTAPCTTVPPVEKSALYVTATYTSPSIGGLGDFDLRGAGTFRCEYK